MDGTEFGLGAVIGWSIAGVIVLALLLLSIVITPGKRAKVIERFGKPLPKARMSGLSFRIPLVDWVVASINLQLQEITESVSVKTKDNAFMTLPVRVQYRASSDPEGAVRAHYELESPEGQITSYVLNNARQTASGMDMVELYQNRDLIENQVKDALREQFEKYGYLIENVLVDEPQPSNEVRDAFNRVIASEREKEAAQNIADAKKIQLVGIAEAEKQSKKLQGEGIASMRKAVADGSKESMETLREAGLDTKQSLEFLMETNRLDTLGSVAAHGNLILADLQNDGSHMVKAIGAVKAGNHGSSKHETETTSHDHPEESV